MKDEIGRSTRGARFVSADEFHPRADILHPAPPCPVHHPTKLATLPDPLVRLPLKRRRLIPKRRRSLHPVELVPAGEVDGALLATLGDDLRGTLGVQWCVGDALPLREEWMETESGLYRSIHLMHALMDRAEQGAAKRARWWRLAIADAGLCAEGVGAIYGEAAMEGCCAVVGLAPLRAGSGADAGVLRDRLVTEAVHELGHLAGLAHCRNTSCVMYPSLHIADTDHKRRTFCRECRRPLKLRGLQES